MRKLLQRWPDLAAAAAAAANPKLKQQVVVCSRKASDSEVLQLAARSAASLAPLPVVAPSASDPASVVSEDEEFDPAGVDAPKAAGAGGDAAASVIAPEGPAGAGAAAAAAAAAAATAAAAVPDRLTLELGWDTFQPRILLDDAEGEEEEEPVVEFALAIYNLQVRMLQPVAHYTCRQDAAESAGNTRHDDDAVERSQCGAQPCARSGNPCCPTNA
jgi:hypothetical protein